MKTKRNRRGTGRQPQFGWNPPADVRAILDTFPKGTKADKINDAIRAVYGQGQEAAKAHLKAVLGQVES